MATIRKRQSGKWQVIIRKKNYPSAVRSFLEKSTATKFAKDVVRKEDDSWTKDHVQVELGRLLDNGEIVKVKKGIYKSAPF